MKKVIIVLLFLIFFNILVGYAQEAERKYSIQANPVLLFVDTVEFGINDKDVYLYPFIFEFQYKLNNRWNIFLRQYFYIDRLYHDGGYKYDEDGNETFYKDLYKREITFNLMPGVIFRPFATGLKGMYVELYPTFGWRNIKTENFDNKNNIIETIDNCFIIGLSAETGYEWIFKNGFTITLGGGIGKNWIIGPNNDSSLFWPDGSLYNFRGTFLMGYSF
jgi:hypothetical protein